ncbi:kinase-like domain-containing protein [Daldinia sp. FL1419]|nr:kinase-like domain-containing protein [Daldinia sp. FL1419]
MEPSKRLYQRAVEDTGEVEDRERYRPGGYHPIHFNDSLGPHERFVVIHKLGWGANCTVWLCFDKESCYYRSVKVMTAETSVEGCPELHIMEVLSDVSRRELEENHVIIPREYFWLEGPNGRHLCLVSDLLGPSLFRNSPLGTGIHTPELLTDLSFQIAKGLQYLHGKGVCHGDLRPSNVFMQLHQYSLMELRDSQVYRYLGPRLCETLQPLPGTNPSPHGPRYLALPATLEKLETKCRTNRVALIEFSHSFRDSSSIKPFRWHRQYAGPELLFTKTPSGFPQDIWALACTIYEVKLKTQLFSEYQDYSSLIRQMELWFGPLPVEYRQIASNRLNRDKKRRPGPSDENPSTSSATLLSEDRLNDPHQLLSLSPDEEKRARSLYMEEVSWPGPLQASLGRERRYYVHEESDAGYTSSEDTEFSSIGLGAIGQGSSFSDDGSQEDVNVQSESESGIQGTENQDGYISEHSDEENEEGLGYSPSRRPTTLEDLIDVFQDDEDASEIESLVEVKGSLGHDADGTGEARASIVSSPSPSLSGSDDSEPSQGRETKRKRTSEDTIEGKRELVERVVRMPKEEVLLLSDLLLRMFKHDPKERIDIDAVVNHEYWGDRRNRKPVEQEEYLSEEDPDPISSRTRSRAPKPREQADSGSP